MQKRIDNKIEIFGSRNMYNYYVKHYCKDSKENKERLVNLIKTREYFFGKLQQYAILIRGFGRIDWTKLDDIRDIRLADYSAKYFNLIRYKQNPIPSAEFIVNRIIELNKEIKSLDIKVAVGFKPIKNYELVTNVLRKFNSKIANEITTKGFEYDLGKGLGKIAVLSWLKSPKAKEKSIDWKATFDEKKRLIENGETPHQLYYDECGNIIGSNEGVRFIRIHKSDYWYSIKWFNRSSYIVNMINYILRVSDEHIATPYRLINSDSTHHTMFEDNTFAFKKRIQDNKTRYGYKGNK